MTINDMARLSRVESTAYLLTVYREDELIFSLSPDGTIVCEPENYELALREICQIFVSAAA